MFGVTEFRMQSDLKRLRPSASSRLTRVTRCFIIQRSPTRSPQAGHNVATIDQQEVIPRAREGAFDVVALASSAGGLGALSEVLSALPSNFPAAIAVVQHLDPRHRSLMAKILSGRTALTVKEAEEGDRLQNGTVYVAPPDKHLLINGDGTISLSNSKMVHFVRPSADLLFESVAGSYKDRAIGVVLTGSGSDGAMGVQAIKKMGGTVIAQDEETAEFFGMPGAAIQSGSVDFVLPLKEISAALVTLVMTGEPV
jgi:two-component system chemotaxis response regulator CheB